VPKFASIAAIVLQVTIFLTTMTTKKRTESLPQGTTHEELTVRGTKKIFGETPTVFGLPGYLPVMVVAMIRVRIYKAGAKADGDDHADDEYRQDRA
jgi:hypothetical protein